MKFSDYPQAGSAGSLYREPCSDNCDAAVGVTHDGSADSANANRDFARRRRGDGYPAELTDGEWARWGRQHDWYASCERDAVRLLSEFAAPTLAYGVSDDPIAPPRAVSTFLDRFFAVDPARRKLEPAQFGVKAIGYVGLLRPAVGTAGVWQEMLEFLNDNVGTESIR